MKSEMTQMYLEGYTLQEIGDQYGLTRERVRQIINPFGKLNGFEIRKKRAEDFYPSVEGLPCSQFDKRIRGMRVAVSVMKDKRGNSRNRAEGGAVLKGQKVEEYVSYLLKKQGINNTLMPIHRPFNILLENGYRIEVAGASEECVTSERQVSPMYKFRTGKNQGKSYDFLIAHIVPLRDTYIIPSQELGNSYHIYVCYPTVYDTESKWTVWKDRFDLLR